LELRPFVPLFRNPHLLTLAGNFWPRHIDTERFPSTRRDHRITPGTTVVAYEHQPETPARAQLILLHGLEGSADAGYITSLAQDALERGFAVHRLNLRTCGGTEELCDTMYHSGLTSDTREVARRLKEATGTPVFLTGFSLGGNVALKLAGELGESELLAGVMAVSTPIELAESVRRLDKPANLLYARRFLDRLRARVRRKSELSPGNYSTQGLDQVKTMWEFDDRFTAPLFGFGTAENYYATQSAARYIDQIRTPTLVITAKDDPLVPFASYRRHFLDRSPSGPVQLIATEHGGHLGFLSKSRPRFWVDGIVLDWCERTLAESENVAPITGTKLPNLASA
jgi:uncharacterized protein